MKSNKNKKLKKPTNNEPFPICKIINEQKDSIHYTIKK